MVEIMPPASPDKLGLAEEHIKKPVTCYDVTGF